MMIFCFDMDGTLLNSMPTLRQNAVDLISEEYHMTREDAESAYNRTVGIPFYEQLQQLFPNTEKNGRVASVYEMRHRDACPMFQLAPGIEDAIQEIKMRGHGTALVTSTDYHLLDSLPQVKKLHFNHLGGFRVDSPKLAQLRNVTRMFASRTTILFGDSPYDGWCAEQCGISFRQVNINNVAATVMDTLLHWQ